MTSRCCVRRCRMLISTVDSDQHRPGMGMDGLPGLGTG